MTTTSTSNYTSWLRRFAFRFTAAYLVLFNLPFPLDTLGIDVPSGRFWRAIVSWVAIHVLQIGPVTLGGDINGDTAGAWVRVCCCLVLALAAATVWVWFDRQRRYDRTCHDVLRVYVRYLLALWILYYAMAKLVGMQFPFPEPDQLARTYGESEPFELMWTFMGYSMAYSLFAGLAELAGALLLLFRRTTTLGALITAAVMTNIVMLDLSYDVPVKLISIHLLLFALFLLVPDLRRLANVLVLNRPTEAVPLTRVWPAPWMRPVVGGLMALFIAWNLYGLTMAGISSATQSGYWAEKPTPYGLYDVETFVRDGSVVPPLLTDTTRWRTVGFNQRGGTVAFQVRHMNNSFFLGYRRMTIDSVHGTLTLDSRISEGSPPSQEPGTGPAPPPLVMAFTRPAPDQMRLEGNVDGSALSVLLRRVKEENFSLIKREFRWIRRR